MLSRKRAQVILGGLGGFFEPTLISMERILVTEWLSGKN